MGKMQLFGAFANGHSVTLRDHALRTDVSGVIQCIYLESGFHFPETPHNFMVRLVVEQCADIEHVGTTREVYVRTLD